MLAFNLLIFLSDKMPKNCFLHPVIIPEGESPVRRRQTEKWECPEPEGHFPDPDRCNVYYRWLTVVVPPVVVDVVVVGVFTAELPS